MSEKVNDIRLDEEGNIIGYECEVVPVGDAVFKLQKGISEIYEEKGFEFTCNVLSHWLTALCYAHGSEIDITSEEGTVSVSLKADKE